MTFISTRRTAVAIAAAACMAIPAAAQADYSLPSTFTTDAAQSTQARPTGDAKSTLQPSRNPRGDNPAEHPGMSGAKPAPTTIEVVRPERTIVRDVDEALPIALSGAALLLVLAALAGMLVRSRLAVPRPDRSN